MAFRTCNPIGCIPKECPGVIEGRLKMVTAPMRLQAGGLEPPKVNPVRNVPITMTG